MLRFREIGERAALSKSLIDCNSVCWNLPLVEAGPYGDTMKRWVIIIWNCPFVRGIVADGWFGASVCNKVHQIILKTLFSSLRPSSSLQHGRADAEGHNERCWESNGTAVGFGVVSRGATVAPDGARELAFDWKRGGSRLDAEGPPAVSRCWGQGFQQTQLVAVGRGGLTPLHLN